MVTPGAAFCFDPFSFHQGGNSITNDKLVEWCSSSGIKSVKLLWQTKENGDVGDPVMGIANSDDDHTNIVDIKRTDGSSITLVPMEWGSALFTVAQQPTHLAEVV